MRVTYENKDFEIEKGTKIIDAFRNEIENSTIKDIIAVKFNNTIESLDSTIEKNGTIEFISRENKEGRQIYIRGLIFLTCKAFYEIFPNAHLTVNYQLSDSMFGTVENMEVTEDVIKKVKARMDEIIRKNLPIIKTVMTQEEAKAFYEKENTLRGRIQVDVEENLSLYFCEDYYNYLFGIMPISTNFATIYDLVAYRNGFLIKYPNLSTPNSLKENDNRLKIVSAMEEYDKINKLLKINTFYRLNKKISEPEGQKELILISEAIHEKKIAEIANTISNQKNIRMILIAGPSSSGKTTFAQKLGIALKINGMKPVNISVDNYFVERENNPKDENGNFDFECIEAIDTELFNSHLLDLLNGKEVKLPIFDFKTGKKNYYDENILKLNDDDVLVIEGIHCLNDKLTSLIPKENKFKIYISDLTVLNIDYYNRISTTDTRLIRRIVRDYKYRNYSAQHTLNMWYSVNRGEQKNIFPFQEEADCMFNSSLVYELAVLKKYALPLLQEISENSPEYADAQRLVNLFKYIKEMDSDLVPNDSLLREFIGGSIFYN